MEIVDVAKRFGATAALERIDLSVEEGEFVSLLGPSGCGKSTLLRIVAGLEAPSSGRVLVGGEDMTARPPERRPTNLVFQRGALFPHMNVAENIGYGLRLRGLPRARINARVDEMLTLVRLEGFGGRDPSQLSGGQAQRVALARALAGEPKVLLLDEPLSALDLKLREQMQVELRAIQRKLAATFIFVTHDQTEALAMSDRIAIMKDGRILQYGTPQEIYRHPASMFVSAFVGQTNFRHGTIAALEGGEIVLATGASRLRAPVGRLALGVGEAATLSVRPEAIRLLHGEEPLPDGCGERGTVAEIVYLGSSVRVGVAVTDGVVVWADLRGTEAEGLVIGRSVGVAWAKDAATLFEGEGR